MIKETFKEWLLIVKRENESKTECGVNVLVFSFSLLLTKDAQCGRSSGVTPFERISELV